MQKWDHSLSVFVCNNTVDCYSQVPVKWSDQNESSWSNNVMKWGKDKELSVESWSDDLSSVIS